MITNVLKHPFLNELKHNRLAMAGACIILSLLLCALFAPVIAPYDPAEINVALVLSSPSDIHFFGTDELGRDVFSRVIWGARISMFVGFVAISISTIIGVTIGAIAGFYGGRIDSIIMRIVDIMLCFPTFILILTIIAIMKPNIWNIMIVIGLTSWMGLTRLVRAEFLSLRERDFVLAARSVGASDLRIIFSHILPNAMAPILVSATLGVAAAIITESSLSFLGIGVQPPTPSWGNMLTAGKDTLQIAWWLSLFPGIGILITVLGYNLLGEGIRDAMDPRLRR